MTTTLRNLMFALLLLIGSACTDRDGGDGGVPAADERDASRVSCTELEAEASGLLDSAQVCNTDADCRAATVQVDCLAPFLCVLFVNVDTDLDGLERRARSIAEPYQENCGCAFANCGLSETTPAECDTSAKRCRPLEATPDDADGG